MISERISDNENFEYGYPHSNALLQFPLKLEYCKPQNDVKTISDSISQDILSQMFEVIQSDVALQQQVH